jgi:hypothetical protein
MVVQLSPPITTTVQPRSPLQTHLHLETELQKSTKTSQSTVLSILRPHPSHTM